MSKAIATTNEQRRVEFQTRDLYPVEDCNIIIPYLPTGYEDYSNMGYVNGQYQISDYLTYKRIGTGNDCFIVTGKGSTQIIDNDTSSPITATGQCGEYILGYNTSTFGDVSIETDTAFTDYKKTVSRNTLTFRIDAQRTNTNSVTDLTENYKYMFYKVPEVTGDILLKVVSLETEYVGRKKIAYVLTLNSLQQDLETTGQARSQNVMPNAPGQGYYDPKIYDLETASDSDKTTISTFKADKDHLKVDANRWITYDIDKYVNDPVKYVVVKLFGNAFFCDFAMIGRRATKLEAGIQYGTPRWIFPINLSQATTPTIYRAQNPEDNFYGCYGFTPMIIMSKDFTDYFKDLFQVSASYSIQGIVEIPKNYTFSNPTNNSGNFEWTLFGEGDNTSDITTSQMYGHFQIPSQQTYNVAGVTGCNNTYTIYSEDRYIHDYIWDAFGCLKKVVQVPLMKENTLTFGTLIGSGLSTTIGGLSSGSGFSAIFGLIAGATLFTIGIAATEIGAVGTPNLNEGLLGCMSASLLSMMCAETQNTVISSDDNYEYFFLNYLFGEGTNDYLTWFDTKSMMTAFQADLTDRFMRKGDTTTYTTDLIGQQTDSDGNNVLSDGSYLYIVGGETLQAMESDNDGFIIDGFNLQSVFSGDFSVEFLNADKEVIWYGVYMTSAKWTGSIRSLNTFKNTSIYGRESIYLSEPKDGPASVAAVGLDNVTSSITKSLGLNNSYSYTGTDIITLKDYLTGQGGTYDNNLDVSTGYNAEYVMTAYFNFPKVLIKDPAGPTMTADHVTFSFRKDVTSSVNTSTLIATSGVVLTQTTFSEKIKRVVMDVNNIGSVELFNGNNTTSYSGGTDDDGNNYIENTVTKSYSSTISSNYNYKDFTIGSDNTVSTGTAYWLINIDLTTATSGCDVGNYNSSNSNIKDTYSYGWISNGYYTGGTLTSRVPASILWGSKTQQTHTYKITGRLTFKKDGVYFQITKCEWIINFDVLPTTPDGTTPYEFNAVAVGVTTNPGINSNYTVGTASQIISTNIDGFKLGKIRSYIGEGLSPNPNLNTLTNIYNYSYYTNYAFSVSMKINSISFYVS